MRTILLAGLIAVGIAGPACLLPYASRWAWGLWFGQALGAASFFWIRYTVQKAFRPGQVQAGLPNILLQSLLRLGVFGGAFFLILHIPALNIIAVLAGYALIQGPALMWQAGTTAVRGIA